MTLPNNSLRPAQYMIAYNVVSPAVVTPPNPPPPPPPASCHHAQANTHKNRLSIT